MSFADMQILRRSGRIPVASAWRRQLEAGEGTMGEEYSDYVFSTAFDNIITAAILDVEVDPKSLAEAQSSPDWPCWKEAMDCELTTLEKAGTWVDVPCPSDKNIVGLKWVYRVKRKADGSVNKYKVRLVARGFTQIYGVDYFTTFSPVAKLSSFRTILAIAARHNWEIESFDFNAAYLNGELDDDKEIYMHPPPGYNTDSDFVKRLRKALYGLKQVGQKWYDTLLHALGDIGFSVSQADPGVFIAKIGNDILILAVHVDDCIFTGSSALLITEYKEKINSLLQYGALDLADSSIHQTHGPLLHTTAADRVPFPISFSTTRISRLLCYCKHDQIFRQLHVCMPPFFRPLSTSDLHQLRSCLLAL
jgi:hypothetical protein